MALVHAELVKEFTTTLGTGAVTLSGIFAIGFQLFADRIGDGNTTHYIIRNNDNGEYEEGLGTVNVGTGSTTLSRDHVFESSNSDALVDFSVGTKIVMVSPPAFYGSPAFALFGLIADLSVTQDVPTTIDWDDPATELINVGGLVTHDLTTAGDSERFTVAPRGEGRILIVGFGFCFDTNSTDHRLGRISQFDSGDTEIGRAEVTMEAVSDLPTGNVFSRGFPVSEGDYFKFLVDQGSNGALDLLATGGVTGGLDTTYATFRAQ